MEICDNLINRDNQQPSHSLNDYERFRDQVLKLYEIQNIIYPRVPNIPYRMKIQSVLYGNIKNYRINSCKITKQPTEDKYSCAPIKIVGFLPREAGEGIMLPYDITLLTGSDFDKH